MHFNRAHNLYLIYINKINFKLPLVFLADSQCNNPYLYVFQTLFRSLSAKSKTKMFSDFILKRYKVLNLWLNLVELISTNPLKHYKV